MTVNGRTYKIGGVAYTVSEVKGLQSKYGLFGHVRYGDCTIEIDADLSDERKQQTLIHELLHGMLFEAGYTEQDEDLVNRVSAVLHQVINDNFEGGR